jgi:UDPglucose 6-dehydrogenase|tara:strand:+ start:10262 stop:11092 length:831 start_codon:yes stop_codon:yes gene_type:complete
MNIGIIGQGFVGNAIYQKLSKYYKVFTYDLMAKLSNSTFSETIERCKIVFVCLPTPMNSDGSCNLDIIEGVLSQINEYTDTKRIVVIKSTMIPGSTDEFNSKFKNIDIVFNPEFLTEANAVDDFENQSRLLLGGSLESTTKIKQIFSAVFRKTPKIIKTDAKSAELVKYVTNTFLATKVSFANEIYKLCESLELDYDKIIEMATLDPRLGDSHWGVPGPDGDFGYGGHCFPKDLAAIIKMTKDKDTLNHVLKAAQATNDAVRNNRDWEKMKGRAVL